MASRRMWRPSDLGFTRDRTSTRWPKSDISDLGCSRRALRALLTMRRERWIGCLTIESVRNGESAQHIPLIPAKAGIQHWVPAFAGTSGTGKRAGQAWRARRRLSQDLILRSHAKRGVSEDVMAPWFETRRCATLIPAPGSGLRNPSSPRRRGPIRCDLSIGCGVWVPGLAYARPGRQRKIVS